MNKKLMGLLSGVVLYGLSVSMVQATVVTYNYVAVGEGGSSVTGTFGYDDSVIDADPNTTLGDYQNAGFLTGIISGTTQDGYSFNFVDSDVIIRNDYAIDSPATHYEDYFEIGGDQFTFIHFLGLPLVATPTLPLDSDELTSPTLIHSLEHFLDWGLPGHELSVGDSSTFHNFYSLTEVRRVPEPATLALLGLGLAGIGVRRHRSKKAA